MGQSFTGAALQSIGTEPSLYRAPDGTLFTVDADGRAIGLDGAALSPVPSGNVYLAGDGPFLGFDDADGTAVIVQSDGTYTLPDGSAYTLAGVWRPWDYDWTAAPPDPCELVAASGTESLWISGFTSFDPESLDLGTLPTAANALGPVDSSMMIIPTDATDGYASNLELDALPDSDCKTVTGGRVKITMGNIVNTENLSFVIYVMVGQTPIAALNPTVPPANTTTTYTTGLTVAIINQILNGTASLLIYVNDHNTVQSTFEVDALTLEVDWIKA